MGDQKVPGGNRFYHDSGHQRFITATGRCNLNCCFCPEPADRSESGDQAQLGSEPSLREVIDAACCTGPGYEIQFSGPGEPTYRLYDILRAGRFLRGKGVRVVLNTNGLANRIHNRPVAPDLEDNVDCLNVNLPAANALDYDRICRPGISNAFDSIIEFIESARDYVPELTLAVPAGQPEIDLVAIQNLAKDLEVGIRLHDNTSLC